MAIGNQQDAERLSGIVRNILDMTLQLSLIMAEYYL